MLLIDSLLTLNYVGFADALAHIIMPGLVLAFGSMAWIVRMTRSTVIEVLESNYIRTARAYGFPRRIVIYKYALRNALGPTTTTIGVGIANLLVGSVLVEYVFAWPGMGRYAVNAINALDFPGLMGYTLVAALAYTLASAVVDILYGVLDPRVRAS